MALGRGRGGAIRPFFFVSAKHGRGKLAQVQRGLAVSEPEPLGVWIDLQVPALTMTHASP